MNVNKAKLAILEAERFIAKAKQYIGAEALKETSEYRFYNPKEAGAVRRASMDLTRCLADMRKAD